MIQHGEAPYYECSSKGDKRFSAFYARLPGGTIEELYQSFKVFEDGTTGLTWKEAKQKTKDGIKIENYNEAKKYYSELWDEYIRNHPELLRVLSVQTGLSDIFGQEGRCCQATELWRIKTTWT